MVLPMAAELAGRRRVSVQELLRHAERQLKAAGIPSPSDDARLLMAEALSVSRTWVLANPEAEVPPDRRLLFLSYVARRADHEPAAYIIGHRGFYDLDLEVTPAVLIPRPETELLVEGALEACWTLVAAGRENLLGADLGTGSGAVAIALAVHQPRLRLIAVDRSPAALEVARRNAARYQVLDRIEFREGDLLEGVEGPLDLLVANLPYVPSASIPRLMPDVRGYEPLEALDGGPDGTTLIHRTLQQAIRRMGRPSALRFEIGDGQGRALIAFAARLFPRARVQVARDYAGFERILSIDLP